MEQPEIQPSNNDGSTDEQDIGRPPDPADAQEKKRAESSNPRTGESGTPQSHRLKDFCDAGVDRHIELILAFAIAFFAAAQWVTSCQNNASTSTQVSNLITAANRIDDAADSFSRSAAGINSGVDNAVGKLGDQAQKMEESRKSSEAQSHKALQATIDNSHRDERVWLGVADIRLTLNKTDPIQAETDAAAFGKSPAVDVRTKLGFKAMSATHALQESDLVLDPRIIKNGTAFPGARFPLREKASDPISNGDKALVDAVLSKRAVLYFYGETKYRDVFHKHHWTHFCYAITSADAAKTSPCPIYNDSDADEAQE